jgi:hypothetical protein
VRTSNPTYLHNRQHENHKSHLCIPHWPDMYYIFHLIVFSQFKPLKYDVTSTNFEVPYYKILYSSCTCRLIYSYKWLRQHLIHVPIFFQHMEGKFPSLVRCEFTFKKLPFRISRIYTFTETSISAMWAVVAPSSVCSLRNTDLRHCSTSCVGPQVTLLASSYRCR